MDYNLALPKKWQAYCSMHLELPLLLSVISFQTYIHYSASVMFSFTSHILGGRQKTVPLPAVYPTKRKPNKKGQWSFNCVISHPDSRKGEVLSSSGADLQHPFSLDKRDVQPKSEVWVYSLFKTWTEATNYHSTEHHHYSPGLDKIKSWLK